MPNSKNPRRNAGTQPGKPSRSDQQNRQQEAAQPRQNEPQPHGRSNDLRYPDWGDTTGTTGQP